MITEIREVLRRRFARASSRAASYAPLTPLSCSRRLSPTNPEQHREGCRTDQERDRNHYGKGAAGGQGRPLGYLDPDQLAHSSGLRCH